MYISRSVLTVNLVIFINDLVMCSKTINYTLPTSCGKDMNEELAYRVFGGSQTGKKDHPSLALLMYRDRFVCAGTVICDRFILTAAHCLSDKFISGSYVVKLGVHDHTLSSKNIKSYPVTQIIKHEDFKRLKNSVLINDIALLEVDSIAFSDYIQPICLPTIPDVDNYKSVMLVGWGVTTKSGVKPARSPQRVILSILTNKECKKSPVHKAIGKIKNIDKMTMCAHKHNADACRGDSGGPIYFKTKEGQSVQLGIVSFGVKCLSGYPGIYTRLTTYLPWIRTKLSNTTCLDSIFVNK